MAVVKKTFSIEEELLLKAEHRKYDHKIRNFSKYIAFLIEKDLKK